jgi:hypothetical protein
VIDHGHALGHPHGMVVGENHHAKSETDALGQPAQRAEHHLRARGHREAREKVVLDKPHGIEAHLVREHALLDRLLDDRVVVDDRPLHLVRQAQSHAPASRGCLVGCLANRLMTGAHCGTGAACTPRLGHAGLGARYTPADP